MISLSKSVPRMTDSDSDDIATEGDWATDGMVDPLDKICRCVCGNLPSLYSRNTWKFDYARMESGGCVMRSFQFCCDACYCRTAEFGSVGEALAFWNKMSESRLVLKSIREGDGGGL